MPVPAGTLPRAGMLESESAAEVGDEPMQGSWRAGPGAGCPAGDQSPDMVMTWRAGHAIGTGQGNRGNRVAAERPVAPDALPHTEGMSGDVVATAVDDTRHRHRAHARCRHSRWSSR